MTNPPTAAPGVAVSLTEIVSRNTHNNGTCDQQCPYVDGDTIASEAWEAGRTTLLASAAGGEPVDKGKAFKEFCEFRGYKRPTELDLTFFDAGFMAAHPPVRTQELSDEQINLDAVMDLVAKYRAVHSESPAAEQDAYRAVLAAVKSLATGPAVPVRARDKS